MCAAHAFAAAAAAAVCNGSSQLLKITGIRRPFLRGGVLLGYHTLSVWHHLSACPAVAHCAPMGSFCVQDCSAAGGCKTTTTMLPELAKSLIQVQLAGCPPRACAALARRFGRICAIRMHCRYTHAYALCCLFAVQHQAGQQRPPPRRAPLVLSMHSPASNLPYAMNHAARAHMHTGLLPPINQAHHIPIHACDAWPLTPRLPSDRKPLPSQGPQTTGSGRNDRHMHAII